MKKTILLILASGLVILSGCAVTNDYTKARGIGLTYNTEVQDLGNGTYFTAVEASASAGRKGGAESYAISNATKFCSEKSKSLKILKNEISTNKFVNGVSKITFSCVAN